MLGKLSKDFNALSPEKLLAEYYSATESDLDDEDINYMIEDRFDSTSEYSVNEQRVAKTTMSITLYGYIIPDTLNKDLATNRANRLSIVTIIFLSPLTLCSSLY